MKDLINKKQTQIILYILTLLISSILLLSHDPYYGHDIGFHLSRIQSIADCLRNGVFPALIYPNYLNGFGYANGIFYPDLFIYIPALFVYYGLDCKLAYQLFLLIINAVNLFTTSFCIKKISKDDLASCVIACIYTLSSYRFTDLYIRSALGETLCFVFIPFVLLGLYEVFYGEAKRGYYLIIGLVGVLASHLITLSFCVILVFFAVFINLPSFFKDKVQFLNRIKYLFIYCLLSVGITAYFLFPLLEAFISDTYLLQTNPATGGWDRTIPFYLSLIEFPVYTSNYIPVGIGLLFVVAIIAYLIRIKAYKDCTYSIHFLVLGIIFLIMSTNLFPWFLFKGFAQTIQFPWRFLMMATICLLFAFIPLFKDLIRQKKVFMSVIVLIGFTVICFFYNVFIHLDYKQYNEEVHYSLGGIEYVPSNFDLSVIEEHFNYLSNHDLSVQIDKKGTDLIISYSNNSFSDSYIDVPLVYYKGYKAIEKGKQLNIEKADRGLIRIDLENSQGTIHLYYGNTPFRIAGYVVSAISLLISCLYIYKNAKNEN